MKYKGIVFDKDGTLLDFAATWLPTYQTAAIELAGGDKNLAMAMLSAHGYDPVEERILGGTLLAAGSNYEIASAWGPQLGLGIDEASVEALCLRLNSLFDGYAAANAVAVSGLQQTLRDLKQMGCQLGVATNDSYQGIHATLAPLDVIDEFDFLCGSDSGHGAKPGGGMVTAFCDAMRLDPSDVIVVGDNTHDIHMGRNAGAGLCIGVLTGTGRKDELVALADRVLDDISGLPALLNEFR